MSDGNHDEQIERYKASILLPLPNLNTPAEEYHIIRSMGSITIGISLLERLIQNHQRYLATLDNEIEENFSLRSAIDKEIRAGYDVYFEQLSRLEALGKRFTIIRKNRDNIIKDLASLRELVPITSSRVPSLPDELLSQIFVEVVDTEEDKRRSLAIKCKLYKLGKMPLVISGVCKRWRRVALECSSLWRYVNLNIEEEGNHAISPGLEHWLTYGLSCSQELSLDYWNAGYVNQIPQLPLSLMTDPKYPAIKLHRIEISCNNEEVHSSIEWPTTYPLANEVVLSSTCSNHIWSFFRPLVSQARKLVLSQIVPRWELYSWDFLQELIIIGAPEDSNFFLEASEILDLFTCVHNVSKLSIRWSRWSSNQFSARSPPPLTYQQLQSLTCAFDAIELYLHPLQELITFPNLTELIFYTVPSDSHMCLPGWLRVLKSIHPFPLRHLQLPQISRPSMEELFNFLPCLDRLTLTGDIVDALLLRLIINDMDSNTPAILPSLTRLDIRDSDVMEDTLERLITSRLASNKAREGVREITVVNTHKCPGITPQGWQRILALLAMAKK